MEWIIIGVGAAGGRPDVDRLHTKSFDHETILYAFDLMELNGVV